MKVALIVAIGNDREIGKDNDLLWHLPADMKFFKETTMGHAVIMGRKSYESIPEKFRPLPGRTNVVISRNPHLNYEGALTATSITQALEKAEASGHELAFIIGGGQIYHQAIEEGLVETLYITHVNGNFEADTFFPEVADNQWNLTHREEHNLDEKNPYNYAFCTYEKVNS